MYNDVVFKTEEPDVREDVIQEKTFVDFQNSRGHFGTCMYFKTQQTYCEQGVFIDITYMSSNFVCVYMCMCCGIQTRNYL